MQAKHPIANALPAFILAGALTLLAGPLAAGPRADAQMAQAVERGLGEIGMQIELSSLSREEVVRLYAIFNGGSDSAATRRAMVRSALGDGLFSAFGFSLSRL